MKTFVISAREQRESCRKQDLTCNMMTSLKNIKILSYFGLMISADVKNGIDP